MDRDKTRTKSLDAGIVLVAIRLVDLPFAAEFGVERLHRNAIRGLRAIAAAFTDEVVDEDALRRIRIKSPLAAAAFFGGAGLIVDQNGQALDVAQFALNLVQFPAMMNCRTRREIILPGIFAGIVRDDGDALGAFGPDLMGDLRDGQTALGGVSAGHGDRIVVENLVGDVDACRSRGSQREQSRMGGGAIAKSLKDLGVAGE